MTLLYVRALIIPFLVASTSLARAAPPSAAIPSPSKTPLSIATDDDPIIGLGRESAPPDQLKSVVAAAVARHPALAEARAAEDEARAAKSEARAGLLPSGSVTISNYQVLTRAFSNDPQNIIERSRSRRRTDALLNLQAPLWDFGAAANRIGAASSRIRAAEADTDTTADQIALRAIGAWYDVFANRALVSLSDTFAQNQRLLRHAVELRIDRGVAAPGDLAQVDSYIGGADRRLAEFTRALANAEARYAELVGAPTPPVVERVPPQAATAISRDFAIAAAARSSSVTAAEASARASRQDARAIRAQNLPQIAVGVDAGRYGVFENDRDYDVRANVVLRQRLFGGTVSRENQAEARARSATARADRTREEAERDASIAWSDIQALETELVALESSYVASRRSRDVLVERFRVSRGTLFDVLSAEDNLFQSAASYIRTLTERDTARYILLSRMGTLLDALAIAPAQGTPRR